MSEKKHSDKDKQERREEREEKREKNKDILAKEQPIVLESSESDPVLPAMQEFEVDEGGPKGSTSKHPGLLWAVIALAAIVVLVAVLVYSGEWMSPDKAEQTQELQFEEQTVPEDLGAN